MNKIKYAFDSIKADDKMKNNTADFLRSEIGKRTARPAFRLRYAAALCVALLLAAGGIFAYLVYTIPVSFISIDVNPSIELGLNRLDKVVSITTFNEAGTKAVENLNIKYKDYTEALDELLSNKSFGSYLKEDALLTFTVVSEKEETILSGIRNCSGYAQYGGECHSSSPEFMSDAHNNGLSFGKYRAFLELLQYDSSITTEDCKNMTMRHIHDLINHYVSGTSEGMQGNHNGNGCHGGKN